MSSQIIRLETGWELAVFETATSTSDILFASQQLREGYAVLARQQTKGRGRQGRSWASERDDGMYLSLALMPQRQMKDWPCLSFVAALALYQALTSLMPDLSAGLKWPNDVLVNDKKISGILLEAKQDILVIGCGVNLKNAPQIEGASFAPTDLLQETGIILDPQRLALLFLERFYHLYQSWQVSGFSALYDLYKSHLLFLGEMIAVVQNDVTHHGRLTDISAEGDIILETADKQMMKITTGDVTLMGLSDATRD